MSWFGKAVIAGLGLGVGAASQNPKVKEGVKDFFDDLSAAVSEVSKEVRTAVKEGMQKAIKAIEEVEAEEAKAAAKQKPADKDAASAPAAPGASA